MFSHIWPKLLTLLMRMFSRRQGAKLDLGATLGKHPNLLYAGLKLIEVVAFSGLEEFNLHRWMFVFDYFGLQLPLVRPAPQLRQQLDSLGLPVEEQAAELPSPFEFRPFLSHQLPPCVLHYDSRPAARSGPPRRPVL